MFIKIVVHIKINRLPQRWAAGRGARKRGQCREQEGEGQGKEREETAQRKKAACGLFVRQVRVISIKLSLYRGV